jgi:hypothetical protein
VLPARRLIVSSGTISLRRSVQAHRREVTVEVGGVGVDRADDEPAKPDAADGGCPRRSGLPVSPRTPGLRRPRRERRIRAERVNDLLCDGRRKPRPRPPLRQIGGEQRQDARPLTQPLHHRDLIAEALPAVAGPALQHLTRSFSCSGCRAAHTVPLPPPSARKRRSSRRARRLSSISSGEPCTQTHAGDRRRRANPTIVSVGHSR